MKCVRVPGVVNRHGILLMLFNANKRNILFSIVQFLLVFFFFFSFFQCIFFIVCGYATKNDTQRMNMNV